MEEKNEWIPFTELDYNDEKYNVFSIDTRDFHCGYRWEGKGHPDYETIKKYNNFFHSTDEVKELIERYYKESGGENDWRMFSLDNLGKDWSLKYLRIWRTEKGLIICDSYNRAYKKSIWKQSVNKELL